jgi:hypothetical protein
MRVKIALVKSFQRIAAALFVGCVIAAIPSILQSHFKAGSFLDGVCELVLMPGKLVATAFHDRGTESPEFLWRSRLATVVIFGGLTYVALRPNRKTPTKAIENQE